MKKQFISALLTGGMLAGMLSVTACAAPTQYTAENATLITFTGTSASASGKYSGYEIDGTAVSINGAGTYVFSGECADGSITVKRDTEDVTIVLNGLTLASKTTSPLTLNKSSRAEVLAAAGSENTLSDTASANDENAVIKAKAGASLTLGGTGSLTVQGNAKNGIKGAAEASITVDQLSLTVSAADDGLSCDDLLTVNGGTLDITAGGDALKASPDTTDAASPDTVSKGDITISGGSIKLDAQADGVQADGNLSITGGTFDIKTNGGYQTRLDENAASCKGLKAAKTLSVSGGDFTFDTADDALHTNTDANITGGTFTIATGDDAFHADNALTVGTKGTPSDTTPKINITACYEGLEGTTVDIYGGDIDIKASDDGINAANRDIGERSDLFFINIHGGDIYVDADADGLDSNHDIIMNGGKAEIYGANRGGDTAIDCDGTFTMNGGTLFGAGMTPAAGTQSYVTVGTSAIQAMGGGRGGFGGPGRGDHFNPPDDATPPDDNPQDGEQPGRGNRPDGGGRQQNGGFTPPDNREPGGFDPAGEFDPAGGFAPPDQESELGIKEGSKITIQDASGKTLYTATATGPMSNVIFSSGDLKEGQTYTISVDGQSVGEAEAATGKASINNQNTATPNQNNTSVSANPVTLFLRNLFYNAFTYIKS